MVEIFSNLDLETYDMLFDKEFVAPAMVATTCEARGRDDGGAWWHVERPMVADLPQICRFVPHKHESRINFPI